MTIPILKPLRWTHNYKLRKKNMKKLESLETLLFCYSLQTHLTTLHRTLSCRYFLIATVQFLFCCGVGFKKNKMNTLNQHLESRKGLFHHHPAKFTCFGSQKKIECFGSQWLSHSQISQGTMVKRSPGFVVGRVSKFLEAQEISNRPSQ